MSEPIKVFMALDGINTFVKNIAAASTHTAISSVNITRLPLSEPNTLIFFFSGLGVSERSSAYTYAPTRSFTLSTTSSFKSASFTSSTGASLRLRLKRLFFFTTFTVLTGISSISA